MITGWLPLKRSATSWASVNEWGDTTWGLALATAGMGRTAEPPRLSMGETLEVAIGSFGMGRMAETPSSDA